MRIEAGMDRGGARAHTRARTPVRVAGLAALALLAAAATLAMVLSIAADAYAALPTVAAGNFFTCETTAAQALVCFGSNTAGEATSQPGTFTAVDGGGRFACGVRTDQSLACWGLNDIGQASPPAGAFTTVATSDQSPFLHACALRVDQTIACWGDNSFLEATPPAGTFTQVSTNHVAACGVRTDQTLACWGSTLHTQTTPPAGTFRSVGVGDRNACAVRTDGTIACWGDVALGTLPPAGTFTAISAGAFHYCAIRTDTSIACWGDDFLGDAIAPPGSFLSVSAGFSHTCAVRTDLTITCWGDNGAGELGLGAGVTGGGAPAGAAPAPAPAIRLPAVSRLPAAFGRNGVFVLPSNRRCLSRRHFRVRIRRQRAGVTLVSATVAVNGKRVAVRRGGRMSAPVDLRGLPKGAYTVRISARTSDGRRITGSRRYHTCARRRRSHSSGRGPLVFRAAADAGAHSARAQAGGDCTKATATALVNAQHLNGFLLADPVVTVLCGPFAGPGSVAMAVTIAAGTCWSPQRWAVFSFAGGAWRLVQDQGAFVISLVAVGGDLRETVPVFLASDPRCVPSGGRHSRIWRWNGSRLVPGPFSRAIGGRRRPTAFRTPSGQIRCEMYDEPRSRSVHCQHEGGPVWSSATLTPAGRVVTCEKRSFGCVGDPGEDVAGPTLLPYGRSRTHGRFRCRSRTTGVTCVVIASGKGFHIDRDGVTRVGP